MTKSKLPDTGRLTPFLTPWQVLFQKMFGGCSPQSEEEPVFLRANPAFPVTRRMCQPARSMRRPAKRAGKMRVNCISLFGVLALNDAKFVGLAAALGFPTVLLLVAPVDGALLFASRQSILPLCGCLMPFLHDALRHFHRLKTQALQVG
jgi:hypothetical protein